MSGLAEASRVIYLHGFASSPESRKAIFLGEKLRQAGYVFDAPDLAEGDFERLTISNQLRAVDRLNPNGDPVALIGSSLGGYLAALYAAIHPEVTKLVLLAPAFRFRELWAQQLGAPGVESWRQNGSMSVFHYGKGQEVSIGYQLYEDAGLFAEMPEFSQPAVIIHGEQDSVVPVGQSVRYADLHPNVRLVLVESGHELTDVFDTIWCETRAFFGAPGPNSEW